MLIVSSLCLYKRSIEKPQENQFWDVLMGPKSPDSTAGTKPSTEAQLDSATFGVEWFSRSCDLAELSMGFVFPGEGSSFS
jgi:hypothetical protein